VIHVGTDGRIRLKDWRNRWLQVGSLACDFPISLDRLKDELVSFSRNRADNVVIDLP
jgi:hypothetical protein